MALEMAVIPIDKSWSIRAVAERDVPRILAFLEAEPLLNVYLISKLLDEGVPAAGETVELAAEGETVCVASLASNIALAASPAAPLHICEEAIRLLAERIVIRRVSVRAAISDERLVELLWKYLRAFLDPPTVVRMRQPVYALTKDGPRFHRLDRLRYSTAADLDQLVSCCAAMHQEEVGIDPLVRDAVGYRERIRELVHKKRSLIVTERGNIVFKCELSAVTPAAIQLMGVWTHPSYRRHGFARRGMSEICGEILRGARAVTLFVNDFNGPAIALYESLGFVRIGTNRALIW